MSKATNENASSKKSELYIVYLHLLTFPVFDASVTYLNFKFWWIALDFQ